MVALAPEDNPKLKYGNSIRKHLVAVVSCICMVWILPIKKLQSCSKQKKHFISEVLLPKVAVWTGLEPATPCVTGMYSNQLNYQTYCISETANIKLFL